MLAIFCSVVENNGFTKAAQKLLISQSSVSTAIKSLEKQMEIKLINRRESNYDELELTEAGKHFYYTARNILNMKEKLSNDIKSIKKQKKAVEKSTVSIVTNAPIGIFVMPKLIERFKANFDKLDLRVLIEKDDCSSMVNLIKNKIYDIGIVPFDLNIPNTNLISTFTQKISLIARKDFPASDFDDFQKIPLIMLPNYYYTRRIIDEFFLLNKIKPNIAFELNYPTVTKEIIRTEDYATIVHHVIATEEIKRGEFVELALPFKLPVMAYKIVVNQESLERKYISEITNFLKDNLKE